MASTTPIVRNSLTQPLLDRYNTAPSVANVGGGSAKDVGTDRATVDTPRPAIRKGFTVRQPLQTTLFSDSSLDYAKALGVDGKKYR